MRNATMRIYKNEMGLIQENATYHLNSDPETDNKITTCKLIRINKTTGKQSDFETICTPDTPYTFKKHNATLDPENAILAYFADLYAVSFSPELDTLDPETDNYLDTLATLDCNYIDPDLTLTPYVDTIVDMNDCEA